MKKRPIIILGLSVLVLFGVAACENSKPEKQLVLPTTTSLYKGAVMEDPYKWVSTKTLGERYCTDRVELFSSPQGKTIVNDQGKMESVSEVEVNKLDISIDARGIGKGIARGFSYGNLLRGTMGRNQFGKYRYILTEGALFPDSGEDQKRMKELESLYEQCEEFNLLSTAEKDAAIAANERKKQAEAAKTQPRPGLN